MGGRLTSRRWALMSLIFAAGGCAGEPVKTVCGRGEAGVDLLGRTAPVMRARRERTVGVRRAARVLAACVGAPCWVTPSCVTPAAGAVGVVMVVVTSAGVLP